MGQGRLHADEVDVDASLVRGLLADQFPQWAGLPIVSVPSSGTVNTLHRLGEDLVVRVPRIPSPPGEIDIDKERAWLPLLAPRLPVPIPTQVGVGAPSADYPGHWSIHRWLHGITPRAGDLTDPEALARDLAGFVAAMRAVDLPGGPPAYRGGPLVLEDAATRAAIEDLRGGPDLGEAEADAVAAAWQEALSAAEPDAPLWVHADLMPGNLLVEGGRLRAVIDFGTVGVGDPACDLISAWNVLPAGARDVFRSALGVDDSAWVRGRGRALSMALIQLPYYRDTNPEMAENARYVIAEVLADRR